MVNVYDNKLELRNTANMNLLINDGPTLINGYIVNVEYVKKGDSTKKYLTLDDVVVSTTKHPKLRDDLRMDVFRYFNVQLTNMVNRRFKNKYADITKINDSFKIETINIDDYSEDIEDLLELGKEEKNKKTIGAINDSLSYVYLKDILKEDEDALTDIINEYGNDDIINEGIIPLFYFTKIGAITIKEADIPENSYLRNGNSLLLKDDEIFKTHLDGNIKNEILVFTNKENYILDTSYYGNTTIRKSNLDEFWSLALNKY